MQWHHFVAVLGGTGSTTPRRTSLSRSSLTASLKWRGTGMALVWATGVAFGSTISFIGGPVMWGSG